MKSRRLRRKIPNNCKIIDVRTFLHSLLIGDQVKNFHTLPPGLLVKCEGMKILYLQGGRSDSTGCVFLIFSDMCNVRDISFWV